METDSEPVSISRETTFERDLHAVQDKATLGEVFTRLCNQVAEDLRRKGYVGRTVGIKLRYDNFVRSLDESFGDGDFYANQENELRIEAFQAKVLNFDDDSLDGVLVWDSLQYLSPAMLEAAVCQLHAILHKGGQLLTVFHADEKMVEVPSYSYRIQSRNRVKLVARGYRKPAQYYSTRALEKLFKDFTQVKFFLTKDSLREVIIRK